MSDEDVLPVGQFRYDLPVWLLATRSMLEADGLLAALPSLNSPGGGESCVAIFTHRQNAEEVIEDVPLAGQFPLRIDTLDLLAAILRCFERNGVRDVTFDQSVRPGRKCGYFRIGDVLANINYKLRTGN